jgi:hypothetical protein
VAHSEVDVRPTRSGDAAGASARAARHWVLVLSPVVAGVLAVAGALADPAVDQDGRVLFEIYAAEPGPLQWKSLAYHFAYGFWALAALLLAGRVRDRGSWVANVAGVLAFLGITTLPGFLLADFYDSAVGQTFGADGALRVADAMGGMWALTVMVSSGVAGLLLCLPVACVAAWRARMVAWWVPVAVTAGIVGGFLVIGANVPGALVMAAGFVVLSVALARAGRGAGAAAPDGVT